MEQPLDQPGAEASTPNVTSTPNIELLARTNEAEAETAPLLSPAEEATKPTQKPESQSLQSSAQALADQALHFLSSASNETLGACLIGLGAATYIALGRVGLVLIGVVGGVVLHATWDGSNGGNDAEKKTLESRRRQEAGIDVVNKLLNWRRETEEERKKNAPTQSDDLEIQLLSGKQLDYSGFRPETATALTELTDAVIKDYVNWWYTPIIPTDTSFPGAARQTLTAFIHTISNHLYRKRPADAFLDFMTNSTSIMIVFLNELCTALNASPNSGAAEAVDTYLISKPNSNLANVLDRKNQERKLDMVAEDVLQNYLESKTYNCRPAHLFLREILAKMVLEYTIQTCSKPEWINGWIVYLLEDGETELMNAIDAGVEGSTGKKLEAVKAKVLESEKDLQEAKDTTDDSVTRHKRAVSRAQEAMDEAMKEAQRLTQMIAEEDAKRSLEQVASKSTTSLNEAGANTTAKLSESPTLSKSTVSLSSAVSEATASTAINTPTSSENDSNEERELAGGLSPLTDLPPQVAAQHAIYMTSDKSAEAEETPKLEQATPMPKPPFTDFDQFVPRASMTEDEPEKKAAPPPLTLHNATVSIFDDSMPNERQSIRNKPTIDYLIQIEPASSHYSGWMIARKYADFETLHEVLRRISVISGVAGFADAHATLPGWKGLTKSTLRGELERYLTDAVSFRQLAESEGLKRFLEKDNGLNKTPNGKGFPGLGWPTPNAFENMGKGMMNVLTSAPKEVAGGGKALFGGVTGAIGGIGGALAPKRANSQSVSSVQHPPVDTAPSPSVHKRAESTVSPLPEFPARERSESTVAPLPSARKSQDSLRAVVDTQPALVPQMERRPSAQPEEAKPRKSTSSRRSSGFGLTSREHSRAPSIRNSMDLSPVMGGDQILNLPPPPSSIPDDFQESPIGARSPLRQSHDADSFHFGSPTSNKSSSNKSPIAKEPSSTTTKASNPSLTPRKQDIPLTTHETTVTIELLFALITELYNLSSAWSIRKTLLTTAKTFLLRPGNPQLESIRTLLQESVLDANTSDSGLALHLKKLRLNCLPTEEELKTWPKEMSEREKGELRSKARKLLMERGMPVALMGVMGSQATGEALGRVFDALQVEGVARGLIFGLVLQGVRGVTQ